MNFVLIILKGFGQVLLQENPIFGFLIVVGLAIVSPLGLLLSLFSNIAGFLTAKVIGAQNNFIEAGVFGYNGVLIGLMISLYVKQLPLALTLAVIGGIIGAIISYILIRNNILPFAAPFVIVVWGILILLKVFKLV